MATQKENQLLGKDAAMNLGTTAMMSVGDTFEGSIENKFDEDWIAIELEAGVKYRFNLDGRDDVNGGDKTQPDPTPDPFLELRDSKGNFLQDNDDMGSNEGNLNSEINNYVAPYSGTYYINAKAYSGNPSVDNKGAYTLKVIALGNVINGTDMADKIYGTEAADKINGKEGHDVLFGYGGDDELNGGLGNDELTGGPGGDELNGGEGKDTISYTDSVVPPGPGEMVTINLFSGTARGGDADGDTFTDIENVEGAKYAPNVLTGNRDDNILEGGMFADMLYGNRKGDTLRGFAGDDTLDGEDGDDTLDGGAGADVLIGGDGEDTASFGSSQMGVTVRLHASQLMGGDAEGDTFDEMVTVDYQLPDEDGMLQDYEETVPDIESLIGSAYADILAGDSRDNILEGRGGDDKLYGGPGGGDDTLKGGPGDDKVYGGLGDDDLEGGGGNDSLHGGPGGDTYKGGDGDDTIYADQADIDRNGIDGGSNSDGSSENDTVTFEKVKKGISFSLDTDAEYVENLIGTDEDDKGEKGNEGGLVGNGKDNVIQGLDGADELDGGKGDNTVSYERSDRAVNVDFVDGVDGKVSGGHAQGDTIKNFIHAIGSAHDDQLTGDERGNKLQGLDGEDELIGGGGSDTLEGGSGADELDGGTDGDGGEDELGLDSKNDTLSYAASDAAVVVNLASVTVSGGHATGDEIEPIDDIYDHDGDADTDEVDVATFESVTGSDYNDRLIGDHRSNTLNGGAGDDVLRGGAEHGGTRNDKDEATHSRVKEGDTLIGGPGADILDGGKSYFTKPDKEGENGVEHTDTASYRTAKSGVTVNLVTNKGTAGDAEGDTLKNIEAVEGSNYDDTFIASEGVNIIDGLMHEDGGGDTVSYEDSFSEVVVTLRGDRAAGINKDKDGNVLEGTKFNSAEGDVIKNIENLTGSAHNDKLTGDSKDNTLIGGGGVDELTGKEGKDNLSGGAGRDTLSGGNDSDTLDGGAGDDTLYGGATSATVKNSDKVKDTFVFGYKNGDDVIMDFEIGFDRIDLRNLGRIDPDDLAESIDIFNDNVRINLEAFGGGKIILEGITDVNSLDATGLKDDIDMVDISSDNPGVFIL